MSNIFIKTIKIVQNIINFTFFYFYNYFNLGNSINTKLSNLKEKISEEVTIDRAWLIIKKN